MLNRLDVFDSFDFYNNNQKVSEYPVILRHFMTVLNNKFIADCNTKFV